MSYHLWIDKIIHIVHLWRAWDRVSAESLEEEVATYIPNISPYYPGGNCIDLSQRLLEKGNQIIGACFTPCGPISHTAILSDKGIFDPGFRFQEYLPIEPGCEVLNCDGDRF